MTAQDTSITRRMMGAAFLDIDTYEEVEHDETATAQAAGVVALAGFAQAIGVSGQGLVSAVFGLGGVLLGWAIWSGIVYLVGVKVFDGRATWGEVMRALGFAHAPGLLYVFGIIPVLGVIPVLLVGLWVLVTGFIGIRQALDVGNAKTFFTILVGWGGMALLYAILGIGG